VPAELAHGSEKLLGPLFGDRSRQVLESIRRLFDHPAGDALVLLRQLFAGVADGIGESAERLGRRVLLVRDLVDRLVLDRGCERGDLLLHGPGRGAQHFLGRRLLASGREGRASPGANVCVRHEISPKK
jgi:hypothetical protein